MERLTKSQKSNLRILRSVIPTDWWGELPDNRAVASNHNRWRQYIHSLIKGSKAMH